MFKKIKAMTIFSLTLGLILLLLGSYLKTHQLNKKENLFINKTDYDVTLKDNPFFASKTISSNHYYITKLIDKVNITFDLTLDDSYDYDITTTLKGYINSDEVWQKEYPSLTGHFDKKLKKKVTIDYDTYQSLFKDFKNTYDIPLEAKVIVSLKAISKDKKFYPLIEVMIPIDDKVTYVTINELDNHLTKKSDTTYKLLFISGYLMITMFLLILLKKYTYPKNSVSYVLKRYADIIVKISTSPDINNLNIIYLDNINDLINFAILYNAKVLVYDDAFYSFDNHNCYIYKDFFK